MATKTMKSATPTKLDLLLDIATARNLELVLEVRRLKRLNTALAKHVAQLKASAGPTPERRNWRRAGCSPST